jgi:Cdc6-like AAA superfamily ATPase
LNPRNLEVSDLSIPNPFIVQPGEFWADRKRLWETIVNYLEMVRHTYSNEMIVFTGDFGCGTTHTLKYLKNYLEQKGAIAAYITTPIEGNVDVLFRTFVTCVPPEIRAKTFTKIIDNLMDDDTLRNAMTSDPRYGPELVEHALQHSLERSKLSFREQRLLTETGLASRLPSLLELWSDIIVDLERSGWPAFIILDEFDAALAESFDSESLLYNLRRLYDDTMHGLCLIIGLKGSPEEAKEKLGGALYSRMTLQPIHLYPLSKDEAKDFIADLLERKRGTMENASKFHPFSEEAIEVLTESQCPVQPRRLLRICSLIFETAKQEQTERIDANLVAKAIAQYGQISFKTLLENETIKPELSSSVKLRELEGIIELGENGSPNITIRPEELTAREVIGLILYAASTPLNMRRLTNDVSRNWKSLTIQEVSANLSQMKGLVIKEGEKGEYTYRLSGSGKSWIRNVLLPELRKKIGSG